MKVDSKNKKLILWIGVLVAGISFLIMSKVLSNEFVNWDDPVYVLNNYLIQNFSFQNIWEIFSTLQINGSYNPLVHVSWAFDFLFYGFDPTGFHLTNLFIHTAVVFFVYWFVFLLTNRWQIAVLTGIFFGIHPIQVEAVTWISGRKDLLCFLFYVPALITWIYFIKKEDRPSKYYFGTLILFAFSLLSKGIAVTLPITLVLIDLFHRRKDYKFILLEKLPFWVLSIIFGIVAIMAQPEGLNKDSLDLLSISQKVYMLFYELGIYVHNIILPSNLSPYYPFPFSAEEVLPLRFYLVALFTFLGIGLILKFSKSRLLIFGLFLFLVTLFPLLQIIPFGQSFMADRYLYFPCAGLFLMLGAGFDYLLIKWNDKPYLMSVLYGFVLMSIFASMNYTRSQILVWKDSRSLWSHVIKRYPNELIGYMNRAEYYRGNNQPELAWQDYEMAIAEEIQNAALYNDMGMLLKSDKYFEKANLAFNQAIKTDSTYSSAYLNHGINAMALGDSLRAMYDFNTFLKIDSRQALGLINRGVLLEAMNHPNDALLDYNQAIELEPNNIVYLKYRAVLLQEMGNYQDSFRDLEVALSFNPKFASALYWRSKCHAYFGNFDQALIDLKGAKSIGFGVDDQEFILLQKMQNEIEQSEN